MVEWNHGQRGLCYKWAALQPLRRTASEACAISWLCKTVLTPPKNQRALPSRTNHTPAPRLLWRCTCAPACFGVCRVHQPELPANDTNYPASSRLCTLAPPAHPPPRAQSRAAAPMPCRHAPQPPPLQLWWWGAGLREDLLFGRKTGGKCLKGRLRLHAALSVAINCPAPVPKRTGTSAETHWPPNPDRGPSRPITSFLGGFLRHPTLHATRLCRQSRVHRPHRPATARGRVARRQRAQAHDALGVVGGAQQVPAGVLRLGVLLQAAGWVRGAWKGGWGAVKQC
jgi:hypothetical protein